MKTKEIFEVNIDPIPANRHLMKDIEKELIGLKNNDYFTYKGFKYRMQKIKR